MYCVFEIKIIKYMNGKLFYLKGDSLRMKSPYSFKNWKKKNVIRFKLYVVLSLTGTLRQSVYRNANETH